MPFECDDENRLAVVTYSPSAVAGPMLPTPTGGWKAEFTYDDVGRLRIRREYYSTSTGYFLTNTTCYLYNGNDGPPATMRVCWGSHRRRIICPERSGWQNLSESRGTYRRLLRRNCCGMCL